MRFSSHTPALSVYIFSSFLFHTVKLQFYTAVSDLEQLIVTEENVLNSLDLYLEIEEQRLQKIKRKRDQFGRVHELASEDVEQFLWNPMNGYLLIKRLTSDWLETYRLIESPYSKEVFKKAASQILIYPAEKDLIGAADAIIRLQDFYSLDSLNMSPGQTEGGTLPPELTVEDCFILARHAYHGKKWQQSLFWLEQSLRILDSTADASASHKMEILIYIANVHNSLKNYTAAAEASEKILELDPNHAQAKENLKFYREREASVKSMEKSTDEMQKSASHDKRSPSKMNMYRTLCRGKQKKKPEEEKQLYCYTTPTNNNYFLLQPVKVELLNLKPLLAMYHDILRDGETEILKALAYPKLLKSPVPKRNSERTRCNRISKSALLEDTEHHTVAKISRKLQLIIGLNSHPDTPLEVMNFGIGGHYEPHLDYEPMSEQQVTTEMGYPLATWLAYLNDVISGGSTVFTEIGVEIKPIKGAVLFWHNFYKNGTGAKVTRHADCPVLVGSKWVANKWFHSHGNEFIQKCTSNQLE